MSEGILEFEDLEDFFENDFTIDSSSDTSWTFLGAGSQAGYSVTIDGTGLIDGGDTDDLPEQGTVARILFKGPGDVVIGDVSGLSIPAAALFDEVDEDDDDDDDDSEDDGDDIYSGDDDDDLDGSDGDDHVFSGDGDDDLHGHDGDDHMDGDDGDDDLFGDDGDDDIFGGIGDDNMTGGRGADTLHGGSGSDTGSGSGGDDDLFGESGNDDLSGNGGDDDLSGGRGKDDLEGGRGDDDLDGGEGDDDFIFAGNFGRDHIARFVAGHDDIDMTKTGLDFSDLRIFERNGDTIVKCEDGTIIIDQLKGSLGESDFLF